MQVTFLHEVRRLPSTMGSALGSPPMHVPLTRHTYNCINLILISKTKLDMIYRFDTYHHNLGL